MTWEGEFAAQLLFGIAIREIYTPFHHARNISAATGLLG